MPPRVPSDGRSLRLVSGLVALGLPMVLPAQPTPPASLQPEYRLEVAPTPSLGAGVGLGVNVRAGYYARVGIHGALGVERRGEGFVGVQRVEALSRFLFDPFGEFPHGVYGGGGLALRHAPGDPLRGDLVLVVGIEGRLTGRRLVPAIELALGGGTRLTVVWRRRRPDGR